MSKDWLCDGGGNGSERRMKSQRHVVNELSCFLLVCFDAISLTEDDRRSFPIPAVVQQYEE